MKFVKNNIYTSANADKLKKGDKVIVAETLAELKEKVMMFTESVVGVIDGVQNESYYNRFKIEHGRFYPLAYLIERAGEKPKEKSRKYRAFKNIKEFFETWHELYGKEIPRLPFIPDIWLTDKKFPEVFVKVNGVNFDEKSKHYSLMIENKWIDFDILCQNYSFYREGHLIPCGVLIKE